VSDIETDEQRRERGLARKAAYAALDELEKAPQDEEPAKLEAYQSALASYRAASPNIAPSVTPE
jgi:hypothetical protein